VPGTIGARRGLLVLIAAALFLLAPLPAAAEWIGAYWPLWGGNSWTYRNVDPPNDLYIETVFEYLVYEGDPAVKLGRPDDYRVVANDGRVITVYAGTEGGELYDYPQNVVVGEISDGSVFEICIGTPCDTNQVRDWEAVDPALRSLYGLDPQYDDVVLVVTYDRDHGPNLHNVVAASNLPAGRPPPAGAVTALEWYQRGVGQIAFTDVDAESGGLYEFYKLIDAMVSVPEPEPARASVSPVLAPNWPNPFNPRTTLRFDLPAAGRVRLEVYDVRGRLVGSLVDAELPAGRHEAVWDGRDSEGRAMASGTYAARLRAGGRIETAWMGLVR
jgi:hypothetical protein